MSLVGYGRPHLQAPTIYIPYKMPLLSVGIGPKLGRTGSGMIPTHYGIFIPAAADTGPINARFEGGLLKVGVY